MNPNLGPFIKTVHMRNYMLAGVFLLCLKHTTFAQKQTDELTISFPKDTMVVTTHSSMINGSRINYTATAGMQPLWDENGKAIATLQYTYYKKSDETNMSKRPLLISFNGGPGSASLWMHIGFTGPVVLNVDDEGYPTQPYGVSQNPFSVLDATDIVYINPVNTGYSRTIPLNGKEVDREKFFGINADIEYLASWISDFISKNDRWTSPKYIIGESYGGTRASGLAYELQSVQNIYLNGVILVSPADYKIFEGNRPVYYGLNLPYFTATAWHHQMLPEELQHQEVEDILPEVEDYAVNILMPAITKGGFLSTEEREAVAEKMAYYSGISKKAILDHNLNVPTSFFWKELLRDSKGQIIGRLDSRYLGIDSEDAGTRPEYSPELDSWNHSFTPAFNDYLRNTLKLNLQTKYNVFGSVHPWDRDHNNVRDNLRKAMAQNPYLKVMFQAGYYDGGCLYSQSKYTMWQLDPSGKLKDRLSFKGYRSGHMMYIRNEDLKASTDDVRNFILDSQPGDKAAEYK